jgi:hypothetical protein
MQIVVRQTSGLGNQLFQYAAGKHLAKKYRASLRIASAPSGQQFSHGQPRPFLLPKFAITARVEQTSAFDRLSHRIDRAWHLWRESFELRSKSK